MSEPEKRDRWSDLAEELGLPPESAPKLTPAAPVAAEARVPDVVEPSKTSEPPTEAEQPPTRGRRRRSGSTVEPLPSPAARAEGEERGVSETAPLEETAKAPRGEEEHPRRRRRRRSSKKSAEVESESSAEAAAAETQEAGEEERPRRRRHRRGKKADTESEPPATAETHVEKGEEEAAGEPTRDDEGEEEEEAEDFSTWNVPSWAEIIAGLYRPEH